jgi:hypothetical protein
VVAASSRARSKSHRQSRSRRRAPSPRASRPQRTLARECSGGKRAVGSAQREKDGPAVTRWPVSFRPASCFLLPCSPTDPSTLRAR